MTCRKAHFVLAIDGEAGAGKSTTAKLVATRLGMNYIDTGAMYRAVALKAIRESINEGDQKGLLSILDDLNLEIDWRDGRISVFLDGSEVSETIREPTVSKAVSWVSAASAVREKMVRLQRNLACSGDSVLEGRDIGTVVFPDASLKIYMIADLRTRAVRRAKELAGKGIDLNTTEVGHDLDRRDHLDSSREIAPLKKAEDAVLIDTTGLTISEQVQRVVDEVDKVRLKPDEINPQG